MTKPTAPDTWISYIKMATHKEYDPQAVNLEEVQKSLTSFQPFNPIFFLSVPMVYLIDYTTGLYALASEATKTITGYRAEDFIAGGLDLVMDRYETEDFRLFDSKIFPDRVKILSEIPSSEHAKYIFSYNFRIKQKNGDVVTLLQRNSFIKSDSKGKPLLSFGTISNVTHFAQPNPVVQLVEKVETNGSEMSVVPYHKKAYFLNEENSLFSNREKEVLRCMADGLTSKQIATHLFISEFTVINHRKNMMLKCGLNNVASLISYSLLHHIL